ncbi:MAG TPA: gamma-glutamyl-gamma-aminobutyrate hydrolase family protein [Chthonomonadaceae bacterium]|nr:gamma-glutamyl-gamma-aminobutyrate hydrolase family protein [Chthonomonadaceae bacterium]
MQVNVYIGFAQPDEWSGWAGTYARHAQRFEQASGGVLCVIVPFNRVTPERMAHLAPAAVVMSGFARSFEQYASSDFNGVADWLQATQTPILALCGSHQLLGYLYNGQLHATEPLCDAPMRRLRPDEPVTNPDYHPDYFMERGFYPLTLTETGRTDPLFSGLAPSPYLYESHYCEIKALPPGFELLASTPECRIQAMRHRDRPLYGVQFHPEDYNDRFSDGRTLLENFFQLAKAPSL